MGTIDFKQATALIASDDLLLRRRFSNAMTQAGFGQVVDVTTLDAFDAALGQTSFDLLLLAPRLGGHLVTPLLGRLRDGRHAHHPFPVVIMLLSDADKDILPKIVNCGPDDVVLLPIEPPQLVTRISVQAQRRKPFIVTSDFVGPDRRKDERPGDTAPRIAAPNPLSARIRQEADAITKAEIATARHELNAIKIERAIHELVWLSRAIPRSLAERPVDAEKLDTHLRRLAYLVQTLPVRFPPNAAVRVGEACASFLHALGSLQSKGLDSVQLTVLCDTLLAAIRGNIGVASQAS